MKDSNRKSNVLIAEWEGYESYELNGYTMIEFADDNTRTDVDLYYHKSWAWLMPVVKKIKLTDVNLESWRMITNPSNYPIEKVHNEVVEFIKQQKQESMKTFVLNQSWTSEYSEAPTKVEVTLTQDQMNTILNHVDYLRSLGEFDGTIIQMTYLDIQVVDSEYRIGHSVFSIGQYRMYVELENKWNNEDRAEYEGIYVCDLKDTRTSHALTEKTWEEKYKPLVNHIEREKQDSSVADEDLCG